MMTMIPGGAVQTTETNNSSRHIIRIENPNFQEAKQLVLLQVWLRIWTWDYTVQIQQVVSAGLEIGTFRLQTQCSSCLAMLSPVPFSVVV